MAKNQKIYVVYFDPTGDVWYFPNKALADEFAAKLVKREDEDWPGSDNGGCVDVRAVRVHQKLPRVP